MKALAGPGGPGPGDGRGPQRRQEGRVEARDPRLQARPAVSVSGRQVRGGNDVDLQGGALGEIRVGFVFENGVDLVFEFSAG